MKAELRCFALVCLLPLALAACKADKKASPGTAAAFGEVLPGSVSDDMLPYDSLRSRPPLAAVSENKEAEPGQAKHEAEKSADPAADPSAEPSPIAKPEPEEPAE